MKIKNTNVMNNIGLFNQMKDLYLKNTEDTYEME